MTTTSPIRERHLEHEASFIPFGEGEAGAEVIEAFGPLELEYAAIRRGCALFDMTQRGTVRVTGGERLDFLNRMLTQELKGLEPGRSAASFWLNRKGRIDADLRVVHTDDATWFDLDTLSAATTVQTLGAFVFAEDVAFEDATHDRHRLMLAGPTAAKVLGALGATAPDEAGRCAHATVAGADLLIDRHDLTGAPTFDLHLDAGDVAPVFDAITGVDDSLRVKRAGWHALNMARIEAGAPMFHLDFGPTSLPAETGLLGARVNFKKGCYLGQEVVARMQSLGHPKQTLCALRLPAATHPGPEHQPTTGAPIFKEGDDPESAKPIGAVTSSTRSPMLGDDVCCFAQIKWDHTEAGTPVRVMTGVGPSDTRVQSGLVFWEARDAQPSG